MASRILWICHKDESGNLVLINADELPKRERKAPAFHQDSMAPLWHPTTGRMFDSRSAFRAETKRTGGREVGNDDLNVSQPTKARIPTRELIEKHYNMQRNGDLPPSKAETISAFEKDHGKIICQNLK